MSCPVQTDALQRVAAAEVEARRKEAQCARLREEELQRLAGVEERIVEREPQRLRPLQQQLLLLLRRLCCSLSMLVENRNLELVWKAQYKAEYTATWPVEYGLA